MIPFEMTLKMTLNFYISTVFYIYEEKKQIWAIVDSTLSVDATGIEEEAS